MWYVQVHCRATKTSCFHENLVWPTEFFATIIPSLLNKIGYLWFILLEEISCEWFLLNQKRWLTLSWFSIFGIKLFLVEGMTLSITWSLVWPVGCIQKTMTSPQQHLNLKTRIFYQPFPKTFDMLPLSGVFHLMVMNMIQNKNKFFVYLDHLLKWFLSCLLWQPHSPTFRESNNDLLKSNNEHNQPFLSFLQQAWHFLVHLFSKLNTKFNSVMLLHL
jgi:hypothetical protein